MATPPKLVHGPGQGTSGSPSPATGLERTLSPHCQHAAAHPLLPHPSRGTPGPPCSGGCSGRVAAARSSWRQVDLQRPASALQGGCSTLGESETDPPHQEPLMIFHDPDTLQFWINVFFAVAGVSVA